MVRWRSRACVCVRVISTRGCVGSLFCMVLESQGALSPEECEVVWVVCAQG